MIRRKQSGFNITELVGVIAVASAAFVTLFALLLYARHGAAVASWLADREIKVDSGLGAWGDSFGALNATIATLGFVGILITLRLQGRGLGEQARDQHRQRFESSFFELLKLQREARRELQFYNTLEFERARSVKKYSTFSAATTGRLPENGPIDPIAAADLEIHFQLLETVGLANATRDDVVNIYMRYVHSASESTVAPYFRLIYSMLDRVRADDVLTQTEKVRYGNLVRSQLSSAEVLLLGINSLSPISADMQSLVAEFRMLKYLPESSMRNLLTRFHEPLAFAGRDNASSHRLERDAELRAKMGRSVASALRVERLSQCLSRSELAARIGRPKSFVSDYEEGRSGLDLVDLITISRGLSRRPAFFLRP